MSSSMNFDANCSSLSLKTFLGILCSFQMLSLYIFAISSDEIFVVIAFNRIIFVNWSMMIMIVFIPFDFGKGPIISILISCYGPWGISNGYNSPAFLWCWTLFCWYLKHSCTYFLMSSFSSSHQYVILRSSSIICWPGCPTSTESWFSFRISSYIFLLFGT